MMRRPRKQQQSSYLLTVVVVASLVGFFALVTWGTATGRLGHEPGRAPVGFEEGWTCHRIGEERVCYRQASSTQPKVPTPNSN